MRARLLALIAVLSAMMALPGEGPRGAPAATHAPAFDHVFVIVEENMDSGQVVGNPAAPFINEVLMRQNFWFTNYYGLAHGSLPDYLALVSGSEHRGVIGDPPTDCTPGWGTARPACAVLGPWPSNLGDTIESSGRTWRAYLQTMGRPCRWQSPDALYDVTHNPFVYFQTVEGGAAVSSQRCRLHDVDLAHDPSHSLSTDLATAQTTPNFSFIVPDNAHNMHDGNVGKADAYLRDLLTGSNSSGDNGDRPIDIFDSPAWKNERSIAYVVWDEDSGTFRNQVPAIAVGNWVDGPDGRDGTSFNHYSLLRTWESSWGLPAIGPGDAAASPMLSAFNLFQAPDARVAQNALRIDLGRSHPEIYVRAEVNVGRNQGEVPLVTLRGLGGEALVRLMVDAGGHLRLDGLGIPLTSGQTLRRGWHSLQLHYAVDGERVTGEVFYDGVAIEDLHASMTTSRPVAVGGILIDPAPGDSFRNVQVATSPI